MTVKKKGNFDMQRQRGLRGKMGIPLQRYDDSSFNNIIKKKLRRKPIRGGTKTFSVNKNSSGVENGN